MKLQSPGLASTLYTHLCIKPFTGIYAKSMPDSSYLVGNYSMYSPNVFLLRRSL